MTASLTTQELLLMLAWTVIKVLALGLFAKRLSASPHLWLRVVAVGLVFKAALDILGGIALLFKLLR